MAPKGASTKLTPTRLPPLPHLRVRHPNKAVKDPCVGIMSSVLGCWASSGYSVTGCADLERQLRVCMDTPRPKNEKKNNINFHLARLYPKIVGPRKGKRTP